MEHETVLVVAAHADDEVLGCGGTIASHVQRGDSVVVHILSVGDGSRKIPERQGADGRRESARAAAEILGVSTLVMDELPDNRFDTLNRLEIIQRIEATLNAYHPAKLYTHSASDLSADHRIVAEASTTAARPYPGQSVRDVFSFEIRSSTDWSTASGRTDDFRPNYWVTLDDQAVDRKFSALRAYHQEMRPFPHARSIEAISAQLTYRGTQVGSAAAEAFYILRMINREDIFKPRAIYVEQHRGNIP